MFDAMLNMPMTASQASALPDKLTTYLATPVDLSVCDPLKWWWDHRFEYPHLSCMGRDYLSIPGMSKHFISVYVFLILFQLPLSMLSTSSAAVESFSLTFTTK